MEYSEELAKGDEWIKTLYEAEAANFTGGYIINFTDLNREFEAYKKKIKGPIRKTQITSY